MQVVGAGEGMGIHSRSLFFFILISFLFDLSAPIRAQEQDQTLYLIAGAPLTRFTESFPVFLYELSGSELPEVKTLTEQVDAALFVRPYHRYDLVLVGSEPVNGTLRLTVTDINNVEKQVTHEVELCETCTLA